MKPFPIFLILPFLLVGCKVGPDYYPPVIEMPDQFIEEKAEESLYIDDVDLIKWWERFEDPFLNDLIETAVEQNFNYKIAIEQVKQARSQFWIQFTAMLPEVDLESDSARSKASTAFITDELTNAGGAAAGAGASALNAGGIIPYDNFYQVGFDAIWQIDLWGRLKRTSDAAYDTFEATKDQEWGVKLTVISEVANLYAEITAYQKLKEIAEQVVKTDQETLDMNTGLFLSGLGDEQDAVTAQATLNADTAQLATIEATLRQYIYSLAVVLGIYPENLIGEFEEQHPIPLAEGLVPTDIPSQLLRRRPDILAAERQLAAATEQIGVAVAALFPDISLTGSSGAYASNPLQGANYGWATDRLHRLFSHDSLIWGVGLFLTQQIWDWGKRTAAIDVQIAAQRQAYWNYLNTVVTAVEEVESALVTFYNEEIRQKELTSQVKATERVYNLTADLFQSGLASYPQLLTARNVYLSALNTQVLSQMALTTDLIAIYKALGGNW